ncbi:MAG: MarR family winged helix-turn-helix transcriptional regulator [Flavobacterium sp.]
MKIEEILKSKTEYPLAQKTMLNLMYTQNILSEAFNEVLKPYDLSPEQYNVLRILRGQKGKPINMGDIGERMLARTSNTTRLVDKLLLKNLITREICPANRRKMEIAITEKGMELLAVLDPKAEENGNRFSQNLTTDELEQLNSLLEKYRTT